MNAIVISEIRELKDVHLIVEVSDAARAKSVGRYSSRIRRKLSGAAPSGGRGARNAMNPPGHVSLVSKTCFHRDSA